MPTFQYIARNAEGKNVSGVIEAQNATAAAKSLRDQRMIPTTINQYSSAGQAAAAAKRMKGKGGKIKLEDLVIFSRQLATMIRAGLPLIEVLNILSEQADKRVLKNVVKTIEKDVEAGLSFTEALAKHSTVFNEFFISMVRAGEASGMLDTILDQVAGYLEKSASLRRKVKSAVMYPTVVSIIAAGITTFLLVKVVPIFQEIFAGFDAKLPLPTRITIGLSDTIKAYYYIVIPILIGLAFVIHYYGKTSNGRLTIDRFKLRLPIFGPIFLKVAIARFTRTLSTLIRSGVNILSALDIVAKTSGNALVEQALYRTKISIQSGESISHPLQEADVFPPMVVRMIDVGERTGALENMLGKIADFYEDQVDAAVAGLTSIIEPVLIVFLGVVIGFIVISMFMPLFKLAEMIK